MDPPASRLTTTDEEEAATATVIGTADDIITVDPPAFKEQVGSTIRTSNDGVHAADSDEPPLVHAAAVTVDPIRPAGRYRSHPRKRGWFAETSLVASDLTDTLERPSSLLAGCCNQRCVLIVLLGITLGCVMTLGVLLGVLCGTTSVCGAAQIQMPSAAETATASPTPMSSPPTPSTPLIPVFGDDDDRVAVGTSTLLPSASPPTNSPSGGAITAVPSQKPVVVSQTGVPTKGSTQKPTTVEPTSLPTVDTVAMQFIANYIRQESWLETPLRYITESGVAPLVDFSPEELALHWILHRDPTAKFATAKEAILQRYALLTLWFQQQKQQQNLLLPQGVSSTFGKSWTSSEGWATDASVCDWDHIVCNANGRVVQLQMEAIQFTGTISPEVALLSHLRRLNLENNPDLTGPIPESLGRSLHEKLVFLDLGPNNLSGTLPSTLGLLTALTFFSVNRCPNLEGTIPAELKQWTNLQRAGFFGTNLVGAMPLCDIAPPSTTITNTSPLDLTADCDQVDCPCCMFCCPGARNGIPAFVTEPCE